MSSRAAGRMRVAAIVLGVANGSSHLRAQGPALARSNATLTDRFSMVAAVRELSDGRVIVADWRENKISICSFKAMFCDALTRTGDGPGEYRRFGNLFPLAGDSTVISADGRWNVFYKDHFVAQQRFPSEGVWAVDIAGVDRTGRVLQIAPTHYLSHQGRGISEPQEADALAVVRRRRTPQASLYFLGKEADTVATLRGTRGEVRAATSGTFHGAAIHYRLIKPLRAQQQALMFPDGWIAIALDEPYRVDWITPDGRRLRGAPLPFAVRALDDSQKLFAVENSGKAKVIIRRRKGLGNSCIFIKKINFANT